MEFAKSGDIGNFISQAGQLMPNPKALIEELISPDMS
jgi:hypothetical protein